MTAHPAANPAAAMGSDQPPPDDLECLEGCVERVIFHSPDDGWAVMHLRCGTRRVTAVGNVTQPEPGENLRVYGRWVVDARYGRQFRFDSYQLVRPSTTDAIVTYLASGQVEGIGEGLARRLVEHFGEQVVAVLDAQPERVREVPGIGEKRARAIVRAWTRHTRMREVMLFLHAHDIRGALAAKIAQTFADRTVEVLERDPYILARRIRGVGFLTADRIARSVGISRADPSRLQAGLLYCLQEATGEGHLFLPESVLLDAGERLVEVERPLLESALAQLAEAGEVALEDGPQERAVYLPGLLEAEREVAARVLGLAARPLPGAPSPEDTRGWLQRRGELAGIILSAQQVAALSGALSERITVITGGPGTGKTTIVRVLVAACRALGRTVALAAPTGRAAKRMAELAGADASTIHRLLAYDPVKGSFTRNESEPLELDTLVIDESSMIDLPLARDLLRALPEDAQIILIGDANQLPSVGPGSFFRDLCAAGAVPVFTLTEIFRQAARSLIVENAHRLIRGEKPVLVPWKQRSGEDCLFVHVRDAQAAADAVVRAVVREVPRLGCAAPEVQVITPMHRGPLGVGELNRRLQEALNPGGPHRPELRYGELTLREGDRVLQLVNNYDKGVFNGEIGRVVRIDPAERYVTVAFEDQELSYDQSELDQLQLAYAMTIHKSQGSEYPCAVIVMHSTHYVMLRRNLLYTALTRAENLAVIIGNSAGVMRAATNTEEQRRFTRLAERLAGGAPLSPSRSAEI
ncbi:MAG: ATP-dependent RecD-like DNA helicase [Armatimonadota bacterium]